MLTLKTTATITRINRKSSSPCFKDLKVGDVIEFNAPISYAGHAAHGTRATYIACKNTRTKAESKLSFNQIHRVLECCELKEISPAIYMYLGANIKNLSLDKILSESQKEGK